MHYATDTYNIINVGYQKYAINWSLTDGRIFMGIIGLLAETLSLPIDIYVIVLSILSLIISCITVIILKNIILRYKQTENKWKKIIALIISYCTIFNFMYLENLYFVESFVMALSILLFIIAADLLVRKGKYNFIKSMVLVIIGVMCYQGTIGIFFATTLLFSLINNKEKGVKNIIKDFFACCLIVATAVAINILQIKMIEIIFGTNQTRIGSLSKIWYNYIYILTNMNHILIYTCGLFPRWIFLLILNILILLGIIEFSKNKESCTKNMLFIILLASTTIASSFITYLLSLTSFYAGRLKFSIGATIGILFIYLYCTSNIFHKKGFIKVITTLLLVVYLVLNLFFYIFIMKEHKKVNYFEKQEVIQINEYIKQYEKENNTEVKYIVDYISNENFIKLYYNGIKTHNILTYSAVRSNWSNDGVINYYTGRKLEKVDKKHNEKAYNEYENLVNEDKLENGYKCIEDTLYITQYMH
ncbi:MAG: glucosyltransferase domain-containing protein [Clostridia bacterium]|nr:glucosyltransferase domain-containing protein [Clostridia bacterium]